MSGTDWVTATAILATGVAIGIAFVFVFVRRKKAPLPGAIDLRELEAKRDALVQQLREIDDGAPAGPEERARLEHEAAAVLRQLDQFGPQPAPPGSPREGSPRAETRELRAFLWGAGSMAVLALLTWFVMSSATPRQDAQPQPTTATGTAAGDAIRQLEATVRNRPDDIEARIALARAYLDGENMMGVYEQTQRVLERVPGEPRALTYQGIVLMAMGRADDARAMLERAIAADADLLDARVALAWVHLRAGRAKEAEESIAEAIRRHPEEKEGLTQLLAHMRGEAAAPGQAAAGGPKVQVTLQLAGGVAAPPPGAVIFVIVRPAGQSAGPPVAVRRLEAALPATFELSAADSMMGQPLPQSMRIEARVDLDGSATSKEPNVPAAVQDGVAAGSRIVLRLAP